MQITLAPQSSSALSVRGADEDVGPGQSQLCRHRFSALTLQPYHTIICLLPHHQNVCLVWGTKSKGVEGGAGEVDETNPARSTSLRPTEHLSLKKHLLNDAVLKKLLWKDKTLFLLS